MFILAGVTSRHNLVRETKSDSKMNLLPEMGIIATPKKDSKVSLSPASLPNCFAGLLNTLTDFHLAEARVNSIMD